MFKNIPSHHQHIFDHYIKIAELMGEMFSPFLEVIVHDLASPQKSIIAIFNGHITGRKIGDPTTDLGLKRVEGGVPEKIVNYRNENERGLTLKSSSMAIRDSQGRLIGSICLNLNISAFEGLSSMIEGFLSTKPNPYINGKEKFSAQSLIPPEEEIKTFIRETMVNLSLNQTTLTKEDKMTIIQKLFVSGHLNKKSAVTIISKELNISKPTVYKYLRQVRAAMENA